MKHIKHRDILHITIMFDRIPKKNLILNLTKQGSMREKLKKKYFF